MKNRLLLTGSAGFIIGNLVRKISYDKLPYDLISIDKISGDPNGLYAHKNHSFHIADITNQHIVDVIFKFERPDIVIHGAASTHVDNSLADPNMFINDNVLGTQVIVNACVKYGIKKLIFISTDECLGQLTSENDTPWSEDAPLNPRNPYSATKAAGELLIKAAHDCYGLTYNITRSSNNYGPRQTPDKLIPKAIKCVLNNQNIPIYGQGLQIRDWTHVYDNCSALLTVLEKGQPNEIYNISANQEYTNVEVIQKICNVLGKGHDLISFINDPRGNGHDFRYAINSDKIRALGWKPQFKFNEGIQQCVQWYQSNSYTLK